MSFCHQCGAEMPESARFCDQCGAALAPTSPPQPQSTSPAIVAGSASAGGAQTCPQCGMTVIPGEAFCDNCGAPLLPAGTASAPGAAAASFGGVPPQPTYPPPQPVGTPPPRHKHLPTPPPPVVNTPPPMPQVIPPSVPTPPPMPQAAPLAGPPPTARATLAPAHLIVQPGGAMIALPNSTQALLGRADPVSHFHPDIDLTSYGALENGVGRRHLSIAIQNGLVVVEDQDSTNGSFLNGQQLAPRTPQLLRNGDELRLGRLTFRVQL